MKGRPGVRIMKCPNLCTVVILSRDACVRTACCVQVEGHLTAPARLHHLPPPQRRRRAAAAMEDGAAATTANHRSASDGGSAGMSKKARQEAIRTETKRHGALHRELEGLSGGGVRTAMPPITASASDQPRPNPPRSSCIVSPHPLSIDTVLCQYAPGCHA